MKKIAVLVADNYQVLEVWYPCLRLKEEGIQTVFVGTGEKKEYDSREGYPVEEELSIKYAKSSDFDGVVVPGGYAPDILRRFEGVNDFVSKIFKEGKLVAAICHGLWVCVSADILKGKNATCFFAIKDDVINAGASYTDREVVVDGNLISSRNPYDLPPFCKEIIKFLNK